MTRVHVLATGGTIASRSGEGSGATAAHAAEALLAGMDATADVEITGEDVMTVGSYRLGLPELATIARTARERAADPGIDGVVVTHGTDTMEETAFLADLLNGTDTPVVFTGAQRAADHPDTDGPRNLRQAVLAAAHPNARGLGALVAFDGVLLSARGTRKGHTMVSQPFTGGTLVGTTHGDEFRLHVRAALTEGGFTPEDIKEILLQQAIYCGVPAANHAVKEAGAIIAELGLLKG